MNISFQKELSEVRNVNPDRKYWFIRTYGGKLYDYFRDNSFIGMGFNNVPYKYISEADKISHLSHLPYEEEDVEFSNFATFNRLQKFISDNTEYKNAEATKWANQLIEFDHEVLIDDIVIIPGHSSDVVSIGVVAGNTYLTPTTETFIFDNHYEPLPEKRRAVKWLKEVAREDLRGSLSSMFFSRTAVKNVDDYGDIIESNLSTLYIKEERMYLSLQIDQDEEINAFDLQRFLEGLTYLYKEFCTFYGAEENEELYIKIKVQSKGKVVLKAFTYAAVFSIAGIVVLSNNSSIKLQLGGIKLEGHSDGFLQSLSKFKDADEVRDERKADKALERQKELIKFQDSIKKLEAKPIKDSVTKEQDSVDTRKK